MTENPLRPDPADTTSFFHKAATYAVWSLLAAFVINFLGMGAPGSTRQVMSVLGGVIMLTAIPAGIIALAGISRHGRKGLLWKGLTGICVPILLVGLAIPAFLTVRRISLEKAAAIMARDFAKGINTKSTTMIDEVTRLEGAEVGPDKTVTIRATIISLDAREVDRESWKAKVVPTIRMGVEKSPTIEIVRKGVTLIYHYSGKDGALVDDIVFAPADYTVPKSKTDR